MTTSNIVLESNPDINAHYTNQKGNEPVLNARALDKYPDPKANVFIPYSLILNASVFIPYALILNANVFIPYALILNASVFIPYALILNANVTSCRQIFSLLNPYAEIFSASYQAGSNSYLNPLTKISSSSSGALEETRAIIVFFLPHVLLLLFYTFITWV